MSKSADAFRTISEVADWLGVQAHVLRFWESKFTQIKPVKRAGGRRYYRPADMLLLGGIRKLLHKDGLSIKEVQTILRDQGIAHVSQLSHELDSDGPPSENALAETTPKEVPADEQSPAPISSPSQAKSDGGGLSSAPLEETSEAPRPPGLSVKRSGNADQSDLAEPVSVSPAPHPVEPMAEQSAVPAGPSIAGAQDESVADAARPADLQEAVAPEISAPSSSASKFEAEETSIAAPKPEELPSAPSSPASATPEPEQMHMELDSPADFAQATPPPSLHIETATDVSSPVEVSSGSDLPPASEQDPTAPEETTPQDLGSFDTVSEDVALAPTEDQPIVSPDASLSEVAPDDIAQEADPFAAQAEPVEVVPTPQPPTPSAPAASVLSLLATTSHLPAHLKADVAGCAAELRAILNAG